MTDSEKAELRKDIGERVKDLDEDIASLEKDIEPVAPDVALGRITRMEAINAKEVNEANLRSAIDRKARLEKTLARIDDEDFGKCANCGDQIPPARIAAVPESDRCINCAV